MRTRAKRLTETAEIYSVIVSTKLGYSAIIFSEKYVEGLLLPEKKRSQILTKVQERFPGCRFDEALSNWAASLQNQIESYLNGRLVKFESLPINWERCSAFQSRVYQQTQKIPLGQVQTYKDIAMRIGNPAASRAVGGALSKNPFGLIVPCHRVVAASGKPGGFTAEGGLQTKAKLLAIEGYKLNLLD